MVVGYLLHLLPRRCEHYAAEVMARIPLVLQAIVVCLFIWALVQVRSSEIVPFIYFQF